jgi:tetratricopeptide (TPR) repeat protein
MRLHLEALTLELRTKGYELAPNDPWVTMQYGRALEARGRMPESLPLMRKAVALAPLDVYQRAVFANYLTIRGRPTEGLREIERAIEIAPSNPVPWMYKGDVARHGGDLVSSIEAYRMAVELDRELSFGAQRIADNYLFLGDREAARRWMDEAMRRGSPRNIVFEALYLDLNGQEEEALEMALREFDARGAPFTNSNLMRIVVADMVTGSALDEAERFLLRHDDRLADFVAGPVQSFVGFARPDVDLSFAFALQDVYKRGGRKAEADALADRLDFQRMQGAYSTIQLGWTGWNYLTEARWHMRRERHTEALSALERSVELGVRANWQSNIRDDFIFEELWETPRFRALIETIEADMARQRDILAERTAAWLEELADDRSPPEIGS